jgi:hypothetical protein
VYFLGKVSKTNTRPRKMKKYDFYCNEELVICTLNVWPTEYRDLVVATPVGIGRSRISIAAVDGLSILKLFMTFLSVSPDKYGTLTLK